jgi:biotin operon repressor
MNTINIIDYIPEGKENAIHLEELAKLLKIDSRTVKKLIQQARKNGVKIISGQNGYWISDNEHDFKMFARMMRKQAASRVGVIGTLEKGFKDD